jgi:hypothetical protein
MLMVMMMMMMDDDNNNNNGSRGRSVNVVSEYGLYDRNLISGMDMVYSLINMCTIQSHT